MATSAISEDRMRTRNVTGRKARDEAALEKKSGDRTAHDRAARDKADLVLRAASGVFLQHGFSAATTDMIQREAGVSKATVYALYPTKEALFEAVVHAECLGFADGLRAIRLDSIDIGAALRRLATAYLKIVLSPRGLALYRVAIAEAGRFPHLAAVFYGAGPKLIAGIVEENLKKMLGAGDIDTRGVAIGVVASHFVSLARGEAQLECLTHPDRPPSDAQIQRWARAATVTFLLAYGTTR